MGVTKERLKFIEQALKGNYYVDLDKAELGELCVWSNYKSGRWIVPSLTGRGYLTVNLYVDGKSKSVTIHQIVGFMIFGYDLLGMTINHKNGKKLDNRPSNLECVTMAENLQHALDTGLREPTDVTGERNPMFGKNHMEETKRKISETKNKALTESTVRAIFHSTWSQTKIAEFYGVSQSTVSNIKIGLRWGHLGLIKGEV